MLYKTTKNLTVAIITCSLIALYAIFNTNSVYAISCDADSPIRIDGIQQNGTGASPKIRLYNKDKLNTAEVLFEFYDYADDDGIATRFDSIGVAQNSFLDFETTYHTEDGFSGYVELHFTHHDCLAVEVLPNTTSEDLGTIEGTITNESDNVLANIPVTPYIEKENEWFAGDTIYTDANGLYSAENLYPGNVRLRFGPDIAGYSDQVQFYPDSLTVESATNIPVEASTTVTNTNATIRKMTRISGRAVYRYGGAPDDVAAHVYQRKDGISSNTVSSKAWEIVRSVRAGSQGNYVIWDIEPGTYRIGFSATKYYHDSFTDRDRNYIYIGQASDIVITSGERIDNINGAFERVSRNVAPLAITDSLLVEQGGMTSRLVSLGQSVLENDEDANQDTSQEVINDLDLQETVLTAILVDGPIYGTLTLDTDGTFVYQHDGSANMADSFTYEIRDGFLKSNPVEVSIQVFSTQLYVPVIVR